MTYSSQSALFMTVTTSQSTESCRADMDGPPTRGRKQRKMVKLFPRGAFVDVYSSPRQKWFFDGEVVEIAVEACERDNILVPAGSSKIVYDEGRHFQWVESHDLHTKVRKNGRPRQPEALTGRLELEANSWLGDSWSRCDFRLHQGTLQWWGDEEQAASRRGASRKVVHTVGLAGTQLERTGRCLNLLSQRDTDLLASAEESASALAEGLYHRFLAPHDINTFRASSKESASAFANALSAHITFA